MDAMLRFSCAGIDNNFMEANLKKLKKKIFSHVFLYFFVVVIFIPALFDGSRLLRIFFHC